MDIFNDALRVLSTEVNGAKHGRASQQLFTHQNEIRMQQLTRTVNTIAKSDRTIDGTKHTILLSTGQKSDAKVMLEYLYRYYMLMHLQHH